MKLAKRTLAFLLAAVLTMGAWQTVLANELSPVTVTIYIDGQATTLGNTLHESGGGHYVAAEAFSEVLGFPLEDNGHFITFLISDDYPDLFPEEDTRFTLMMLFYDSDFPSELPVACYDYQELWGKRASFDLDGVLTGYDGETFRLDTTGRHLINHDGQRFILLEAAMALLDYDLQIESGAIRIATANTRLGIRPILDTVTPTQPPVQEEPTPTPTQSAVSNETPSSWAVERVNAAVSAGLVPPALQARFSEPTTRAEFATLAVTLYETVTGTVITGRQTFADTTDVNVEKIAYIGVVSGVGNNLFAPNNPLTREQAAVMLFRLYYAINTEDDAPAEMLVRERFYDGNDMSSWALNGICFITRHGIMSGVGENRFAPQAPYTIEQSIVTIMRLFELVSNTPITITLASSSNPTTITGQREILPWIQEHWHMEVRMEDGSDVPEWFLGQFFEGFDLGELNNMFISDPFEATPWLAVRGLDEGFTPVVLSEPRLFTDEELTALIATTPSARQTWSAIVLPARRLTDSEINAWIEEYEALGGINADELNAVRLLNRERANLGLEPLAICPRLMMAARFKSQEMFNLGYFSHDSPVYGRFSNMPFELFDTRASLENIGRGASNSEIIIEGFMNSPGHRENILNEHVSYVGVGLVGINWTQMFGNQS